MGLTYHISVGIKFECVINYCPQVLALMPHLDNLAINKRGGAEEDFLLKSMFISLDLLTIIFKKEHLHQEIKYSNPWWSMVTVIITQQGNYVRVFCKLQDDPALMVTLAFIGLQRK